MTTTCEPLPLDGPFSVTTGAIRTRLAIERER
jgi:hypothetical protein